jgi:probable HAF family extracellular repeat protein
VSRLVVLPTNHRLILAIFSVITAVQYGRSEADVVSITPIGVLSGYASSRAHSMTPDGAVVVGWSGNGNPENGLPGDPGRAILWTRNGGMVNLGVLPGGAKSLAEGVSDDGTVVAGWSESSDRERAFRWTASTGMVDLGKLSPTAWSSFAYDISGDGNIIVGDADDYWRWATKWTASSGLQRIDPQFGFESAYAISDDGRVVIGSYRPAVGAIDSGVRWTASDGIVSLGTFPTGLSTLPTALNADGSVIVGSADVGAATHAFRWTLSTGLIDLGVPLGASYSSAQGVNSDGSVIVGLAIAIGGSRGFVWTESGGPQWLDDYLINAGVDLTGWSRLAGASAVSADGKTIIGSGVYDGVYQGFVATVPEPSTWVMGASGIAWALWTASYRRRRA